MPPEPYRPLELQEKVFRGAEAIRRGLLTEHQLRSRAWIRLRQDVYADARLKQDHGLVCRGAMLRVPEGVVIAGPSAAWLHGIEFAASFSDEVHVTAPVGWRVSAQRGLRIHVNDLSDREINSIATPPRTTATRTAWDVAVWLPPQRAVPILDAMLHRDVLTRADLNDALRANQGRRGSRKAQTAFAIADPAAGDPLGSQLRTNLVLGGAPPPVLQHPVRFSNGLVVLTDIAWPGHRVAIEQQPHKVAALTMAGWIAIYVPPARAVRDFPAVRCELQMALARRALMAPQTDPGVDTALN
ncbi:hypothetical protein [Rhizomonospora bruguierae]|uniref:hypothetical protein n=1 Tax=Rhizomonospora bruguierae TaxID=1581705 RepID=UPI001BCAA64D|nr:hypothetical protein [Micromonospora sp. NBRC 107566]